MEVFSDELERTIEFKDSSNSAILKKITALLQEGEVIKVTFNVCYKSLYRTQKGMSRNKSFKKISPQNERVNNHNSFEENCGE